MTWNGTINFKQLILLQHITAQETIEKNEYKIDEEYEELFEKTHSSEDILEYFEVMKKFPEANK
jgi:hypothetical protein